MNSSHPGGGMASRSFSIVRRKLGLRVEVIGHAAIHRLTRGTGTLRIKHHGEPLPLSNSA
jgi:hypothetical protein